MLNAWRRRVERRAIVEQLCAAVSNRSRALVFFKDFQVADTIDGRFDLLALHAWLVMEALENRREIAVSQRLVDALFVQFDEALRELGAGDMGMSRRMKKMASAFFGRLQAYRDAPDESALESAIVRNLYRGAQHGIEHASMLATYCTAARLHLSRSRPEVGEIDFGPLPGKAE